MPKITTLEALLVEELKDLYSAEKQLTKALPKMAKAASEKTLADGFRKHLKETEGHVARLEKIAKIMGFKPSGKVCKAMKGLIEEGGEQIHEDASPSLKDVALITAAQKVEHYEISGYGTARSLAKRLGLDSVAALLKATEDEEGATDKALTRITAVVLKTYDDDGDVAPTKRGASPRRSGK